MLHITADRVALNILRQGQALFTFNIKGQQSVRNLHSQEGLVARKRNMDRVDLATVQNGGDTASTTSATCGALPEFSADLGGQLGVRHSKSPVGRLGQREIRPARIVQNDEEN